MRDIVDEADKNDSVTAVDVPGVGGGMVDRLIELGHPITPYDGGEAPIDKERFVNARAEDYWTLPERFDRGGIYIDPNDDKLAAQLARSSGPSTPTAGHQDRIEDDMRKRGLPSPGIGQRRVRSPSLAGQMLRR
jgi:hypothetical protein